MYYSNLQHFKGISGYEIDGVWYPRVTKIVEIKAKPALYKFYAEMNNFDEGEAIKKKSADEGTLIHETVEKILVGEKPEIDPSINPAITDFIKFLEEKYRWSSYPDYLEKKNFPSLTSREFLIKVMGGVRGCQEFVNGWLQFKKELACFNQVSIE